MSYMLTSGKPVILVGDDFNFSLISEQIPCGTCPVVRLLVQKPLLLIFHSSVTIVTESNFPAAMTGQGRFFGWGLKETCAKTKCFR